MATPHFKIEIMCIGLIICCDSITFNHNSIHASTMFRNYSDFRLVITTLLPVTAIFGRYKGSIVDFCQYSNHRFLCFFTLTSQWDKQLIAHIVAVQKINGLVLSTQTFFKEMSCEVVAYTNSYSIMRTGFSQKSVKVLIYLTIC